MKHLITLLIAAGVLATASPLVADTPPETATYVNCPEVSALQRNPDTMIWTAKGGWKSFDQSFSDTLDHFLGAQWQGQNVGAVTCLYQPTDHSTFPIVVYYYRLAYEPTIKQGHWNKKKGGYVNCQSHDVKDCSFIPMPKSKQQDTNKALESIPVQTPSKEQGF